MNAPQHLLVFRFSSLGDIAMTVPVIRLLLQQYPQLEVTMVSTGFVRPLFQEIERLHFVAADLKGEHRGLQGLYRMYKSLRKQNRFNAIADLHNVLRTKILRGFFRFSIQQMAAIDKGRKEKKRLTRQHNKDLQQLPSNFQRYANVFAQLGYPVVLNTGEGIIKKQFHVSNETTIGIAPFALHREKTYPAEQMQEVIRMLSATGACKILLFGGKADANQLESWAGQFPNVTSVAGKMPFFEELEKIASLQLMVSMDSANMHLASLFGVPVVSIWGGTHPFLGFYGWGQDPSNAIQIDLDCRPSSVFGNKECRNHLACMKGISPLVVFEKIMQQLKQPRI